MTADSEFKKKFQTAKNHFERVQLCIREERYQIWVRRDKPNLNGDEFVNPILDLPVSHPHQCKPRKSQGDGAKFVIEFKYSIKIYGASKKLYFKGYFTEDWSLKLEVQSLRDNDEE